MRSRNASPITATRTRPVSSTAVQPRLKVTEVAPDAAERLLAAVPAEDKSKVWGEVYEATDPSAVLTVLEEIEGYRHSEPDRSLYTRVLTDVALDDGGSRQAWAYFYNAPLGRAERIESGDYLEHLNPR